MSRVIWTVLCVAFVSTLSGPVAAAVRPTCTLGGGRGSDGTVTVSLGGFNGDNATGTVLDSSGVPVQGAEVDIVNRNNKQAGDDQSGVRGGFDIDLDAEAGHVVDVFVTWTVGTHKYQVQGTCTL
jgi:hypothetical protein